MGLRVLNADGKEVTPIMGSYGIGIGRVLSGVVELNHDKDGMVLPPSIAPFELIVTPANNAADFLAADAIAHADRNRVELIEHVELGHDDAVETVDGSGVAQWRRIAVG